MNYSPRKSYQYDDFEKEMQQSKNENDILVYCIDYIRNYRELTDDMLKKIEKLDNKHKFIIIKEYNRVTKALTEILENNY